MAFENRNLSVVAYANGFTLWHYKNTEDALDIIKNNYFPKQVQMLMNAGDIIIINAADQTAMLSIDQLNPIKLGSLKD